MYYDKGEALFESGKYEEAIECYDKAIELKNDYTNAYANKAGTLEKLGRDKEAIENYDLALAINPSLTNYNVPRILYSSLRQKRLNLQNEK